MRDTKRLRDQLADKHPLPWHVDGIEVFDADGRYVVGFKRDQVPQMEYLVAAGNQAAEMEAELEATSNNARHNAQTWTMIAAARVAERDAAEARLVEVVIDRDQGYEQLRNTIEGFCAEVERLTKEVAATRDVATAEIDRLNARLDELADVEDDVERLTKERDDLRVAVRDCANYDGWGYDTAAVAKSVGVFEGEE